MGIWIGSHLSHIIPEDWDLFCPHIKKRAIMSV